MMNNMTPDMSGVQVQAPQPPQPPIAPQVTQAPVMENGGTTNSSWKAWSKSANWVEIGFMILGTAAFLYMIKYYRYRMNVERDTLQKVQLRTDELSAEITGLKSQKQKTQSRTF
jgi:hypothetical protein